MAIVLQNNKEKNKASIDIIADPEKEYNLEAIKQNKDREASDAPLVIEVGNSKEKEAGAICMSEKKKPLKVSDAVKKYLLD